MNTNRRPRVDADGRGLRSGNLLSAVILAAVLSLAHLLPVAAVEADRQQPLIAVLASDAPPADKAMACKRLAVCGDKNAVPELARLLSDEKLASWSRIALEVIPDPEAADALRNALGTLNGKLLVGAINSLGARRDAASIGALTDKLADADAAVASAAAAALGRIGGPAAVAALTPRLADAPAAVKPAVAEGCLVCAARLLDGGQFDEAARLYGAVRGANLSVPLTSEATRGLILARRTEGIPLLVEQLRSADKASFQIGLRAARELPGGEVTQALLSELPRAAPERQPYLLLALADRGDAAVQPAALQAARSGPPRLRIAAIAVLERLGDRSSLPVLLAAAADADEGVAKAARTALARWPDADVDAALLDELGQPEEKVQLSAIDLIAQRQVTQAIPSLLRLAGDTNSSIRAASLKVLGDLAGSAEIPALVSLLMKTDDTAAVEGALRSICARSARSASGQVTIQKAVYGDLPDGPAADVTVKVAGLVKSGALSVDASNQNFGDTAGGIVKKLRVDYTVNGVPGRQTVVENETLVFTASAAPPEVVDPLCAAMAQASPGAKLALLRILRAAGGPAALAAVRAAAADADPALQEAARRALCDWPSADALPDLAQLARSTADPKLKILALRGQLRLIPLQGGTAEEKLATIKEVVSLIDRNEEKRLALSTLVEIPSAGSLALVATYLDSAELKDDAGSAAVAISEAIAKTHPAEVAAVMPRVAQSANPALAERANHLLQQTRSQ
jgi:HEAT repeat protein